MLKKVEIVDRIEVLENGCVQVRIHTSILENDEQISGIYHRHMVVPGDDYSAEDERVRGVCAAIHTAEVIAAYKASVAQTSKSAA